MNLTRREFSGLAVSALTATARSGANHIGLSRLSAITDEIAVTDAGVFEFCKQYGLQWVEIRSTPGPKKNYGEASGAELRELARQLKDNGIGVSFLDSPLFKYTLPDVGSVRRPNEKEENYQHRLAVSATRFAKRLDELQRWIEIAHVLNCDLIRFFAFSRVAEPEKVFPRVAEVVLESAEIASKAGVRLILENEYSCNVGTSAEMAALLKLLPSKTIGLNWDPENAADHEISYPDAYSLLPKGRIANVQVKGRNVIPGQPHLLDWAAIFRALEQDGFPGKVGLETHIFDNLLPSAHAAMKEMVRIAARH